MEAKSVPLTSKVILERYDYQMLITAAQKYMVQEKKGLKTKIDEIKRELDAYRSVREQLKAGTLEKEYN